MVWVDQGRRMLVRASRGQLAILDMLAATVEASSAMLAQLASPLHLPDTRRQIPDSASWSHDNISLMSSGYEVVTAIALVIIAGSTLVLAVLFTLVCLELRKAERKVTNAAANARMHLAPLLQRIRETS